MLARLSSSLIFCLIYFFMLPRSSSNSSSTFFLAQKKHNFTLTEPDNKQQRAKLYPLNFHSRQGLVVHRANEEKKITFFFCFFTSIITSHFLHCQLRMIQPFALRSTFYSLSSIRSVGAGVERDRRRRREWEPSTSLIAEHTNKLPPGSKSYLKQMLARFDAINIIVQDSLIGKPLSTVPQSWGKIIFIFLLLFFSSLLVYHFTTIKSHPKHSHTLDSASRRHRYTLRFFFSDRIEDDEGKLFFFSAASNPSRTRATINNVKCRRTHCVYFFKKIRRNRETNHGTTSTNVSLAACKLSSAELRKVIFSLPFIVCRKIYSIKPNSRRKKKEKKIYLPQKKQASSSEYWQESRSWVDDGAEGRGRIDGDQVSRRFDMFLSLVSLFPRYVSLLYFTSKKNSARYSGFV